MQESMLANPEYNILSTDNYYQGILQTFMLALCVSVTGTLTIVYLKVIDNLQC